MMTGKTRRGRVLTAYRDGAAYHGWGCRSCQREFVHDGQTKRTYARFLRHLALAHHRLPERERRFTFSWRWTA